MTFYVHPVQAFAFARIEASGAEVPSEVVVVSDVVTISAEGFQPNAVYTVALPYPDETDVDESELRLFRLNPDTNSFALAGTSDQGVSPPTGALGDHGVDLSEQEAWAETTELGTFAVGYFVAVEPGDDDTTDPVDDADDDDIAGETPDDPPAPTPPATPCGGIGLFGLTFTAMGLSLMRRRRTAPAAF